MKRSGTLGRMGRPNLSLENIALTLAALSLGACTKASEPAAVGSDRQPAASASAAPPPPGAIGATNSPQQATASPSASATEVPHEALKREKKKAGSGSASCGAGTCSADMKTK